MRIPAVSRPECTVNCIKGYRYVERCSSWRPSFVGRSSLSRGGFSRIAACGTYVGRYDRVNDDFQWLRALSSRFSLR